MTADIPDLLRTLLADDPGRPRLTWYGPDGERVELSAKVFDNWVAKTANLLVDELDAGPGTRVLIALPTHWRTLVWLLGVWSVGGHALVRPEALDPGGALEPAGDPDRGEKVDVIVTHTPAGVADDVPSRRAELIAVALPALATSFGPALPAGAIDGASAVRLHGDVFVPLVRPAAQDGALTVIGEPTVTHGALVVTAAAAGNLLGPRPRVLTGAEPAHVLRAWLPPLTARGSLVLHHDLAHLDGDARARLITQEGITG